MSAPTLTLADGWSVWIGAEQASRARHTDIASPLHPGNFEAWREPLTRLVTDATGLPGYQLLKYSKKGEVLRARLPVGGDSLHVVCKLSRAGGGAFGWVSALRASRAVRNYRRARMLQQAGIKTAEPLAILQRSAPRRESWLITAALNDPVDLDQFVLTRLPRLDARRSRAAKDRAIARIAELFAHMDRAGLHHRDMKASNLLLTDLDGTAGGPHVWLVDLDGIRKRRVWQAGARCKPLVRLAASLDPYPAVTRSDHLLFLQRYLTLVDLPATAWKDHWHALERQVAEYVRQAHRRKRDKFDGFTGQQ